MNHFQKLFPVVLVLAGACSSCNVDNSAAEAQVLIDSIVNTRTKEIEGQARHYNDSVIRRQAEERARTILADTTSLLLR